MAYATLVSLGQTIDQILNHDKYSISRHQEEQIISIREEITFLQSFLEDYPERADISLERRITDIANGAEDMIEYYMSEQTRPSRWTAEQTKLRFKLQLSDVREEIYSITREVMSIKNRTIYENVQIRYSSAAASSSSSSTVPPTNKDAMVGFEDSLNEIKARLCGESPKLRVIPIVGMGGIGKTTLARNSYDDPLIIEYFDIRIWVTVSQDYSAQRLLSSILVSMKIHNAERSGQSNESIAEYVYKSLKGRRYLIVMDDMWSTNAWDDVKRIFPNDNNGSRIMLTTRLSDVATYTDSFSPLYEMPYMDADQSWNLFQQKLEGCPPNLEDIGWEIAQNCRGLPLAIVVVAGVLSAASRTRASWNEIAKNVNSAVATKDGHFETILSLSYTHLPHHLRSCFLYLGSFPEDYEIRVSKLIKLWIAEGFLKRPNGSRSFEDGAEEYLEDLVKRSLVLVTKRKSNGRIKSCGIHDLLRDLCIRKGKEEKFRIYGSTFRTIIYFKAGESLISLGSLENFRLLRVLDVIDGNVYSLPADVFELIHLRFLAFDYQGKIPAAISNLQNLQTLIIHPMKIMSFYQPRTVYLPLEIWRMPQLRHLYTFTGHLPDPEGATSALENLQTFSAAIDFVCTEGIVKMVPNLKKLRIYYFGEIYHQDYHLNNLVYLHQLEKLNLKMYGGFHFQLKLNAAFPRMLKKLTLSGWLAPWKDMTIVGSLPNLQVLKLREFAFKGDQWETNEGEFPQLKFLLIDESDVEQWITESSHFPSLKYLRLHRCWYLSEIPDSIGEIPTLELIEIKDGSISLKDSAKQIQEEQQSWGNDSLQVHFLHSDY